MYYLLIKICQRDFNIVKDWVWKPIFWYKFTAAWFCGKTCNPHSAAQSRKKDSSFVLLFFSAGLLLILIILLKIPYSLFCIAFSFFATTHLFYSLFSELTSSCCLILATPLLFRFIMLISTIWVFQNIYLKKQKSLKLLRCKDYKIVQKLIGTCGMWDKVFETSNSLDDINKLITVTTKDDITLQLGCYFTNVKRCTNDVLMYLPAEHCYLPLFSNNDLPFHLTFSSVL